MIKASPEILKTILKYGKTSTSFICSYPGFQYFNWGTGEDAVVIAYRDTVTAWVGASEPLGPEAYLEEALFQFFAHAKKVHKTAMMLPVSKRWAQFARSHGLNAIQIGQEPWYDALLFNAPKLARQAYLKGARVQHFDPASLNGREKIELESITQAWLLSRKAAPIEFLNQVRPWVNLAHKKYFRVKIGDQQIAYLSAIPIPAQNSWYLIDLIRDPTSPLGTAELLIGKAAEILSREGVKFFTLGMSPLAPIASEEEKKQHPLIYGLFQFLFEKINLTYNFRSLFQFKSKLKPTYWEPLFLITSEKRMGLASVLGLSQAVYPQGLVRATTVTLGKLLKQALLNSKLSYLLSQEVVPRSPPNSFWEMLSRLRITLSLSIINVIVFFLSTTPELILRETAKQQFEFKIHRFVSDGLNTENLRALFLHSFIHWNLTHLLTNMLMLTILVAWLELLAGSSIVLLAYTIGILASNPLTSLLFIAPLSLFDHQIVFAFMHEGDVGCSLGIFSCLGVLAHFLKRPYLFLSILGVGTLAVAIATASILSLDHLVAGALGYGIGMFYVRKSEA